MANLNNSAIALTLIFNKGETKESKRRDDILLTSMHNGSVTCAYESEKFFAQFRLVSDKQGEVPMFVKGGTKLKPVEQQISAKAFLDNFYGGVGVDTKFYINLSEEICEAIHDSSCKAIKVTFQSDSILERKDEEYKGNTSICFGIENAEIETLDYYFGVGRKVDNNHMLSVVEATLEQAVTKKSNVVTAEELEAKAEKVGGNKKKKLIKEVKQAVINAASQGLLDEFDSESFSNDLEELTAQLNKYKVKLAQLNAASLGVTEEKAPAATSAPTEEVSEAKPLSQSEMASFLLDLTN